MTVATSGKPFGLMSFSATPSPETMSGRSSSVL